MSRRRAGAGFRGRSRGRHSRCDDQLPRSERSGRRGLLVGRGHRRVPGQDLPRACGRLRVRRPRGQLDAGIRSDLRPQQDRGSGGRLHRAGRGSDAEPRERVARDAQRQGRAHRDRRDQHRPRGRNRPTRNHAQRGRGGRRAGRRERPAPPDARLRGVQGGPDLPAPDAERPVLRSRAHQRRLRRRLVVRAGRQGQRILRALERRGLEHPLPDGGGRGLRNPAREGQRRLLAHDQRARRARLQQRQDHHRLHARERIPRLEIGQAHPSARLQRHRAQRRQPELPGLRRPALLGWGAGLRRPRRELVVPAQGLRGDGDRTDHLQGSHGRGRSPQVQRSAGHGHPSRRGSDRAREGRRALQAREARPHVLQHLRFRHADPRRDGRPLHLHRGDAALRPAGLQLQGVLRLGAQLELVRAHERLRLVRRARLPVLEPAVGAKAQLPLRVVQRRQRQGLRLPLHGSPGMGLLVPGRAAGRVRPLQQQPDLPPGAPDRQADRYPDPQPDLLQVPTRRRGPGLQRDPRAREPRARGRGRSDRRPDDDQLVVDHRDALLRASRTRASARPSTATRTGSTDMST